MMRLKAFSILYILFIGSTLYAQNQVSGTVKNSTNSIPIANVEVYDKVSGLLAKTDVNGFFEFNTNQTNLDIVFFSYEFEVKELSIVINGEQTLNVTLDELGVTLSEVEVIARRARIFEISRLKDVEGTSIFAGKKTEVVLVDQSMANLASNNARQIYSQVAGLNIYQNDDAGLQLNVGGRGLDPNRTANFNTRQNGYDISADVLGYPESYYTPAAEGLKEIQIIRGAASLQYGTQFGGLINFKMKEPNPLKPIEIITRNTVGSFGLYTNFTSVSGTKNKWGYYGYFNFKKGDGFRPNSEFESKNAYGHIGYQLNENSSLAAEITYLNYLAQQGGGLTDQMFEADPYQSNRERNWFAVDWLLYNLKFDHRFTDKTNFSISLFGLDASRYALGFRSNRVDQIDPSTERDLIKGEFRNYGLETRFLSEYEVFDKASTFLLGAKYYRANNSEMQGPGSDGRGPDFAIESERFPNYPNQSDFDFPNRNLAVFGENILYATESFSITPGFRFEYINTQSEGYYKRINTDAAGNVIFDETVEDNRSFERSFLLLGLGLSYKPSTSLEIYGNISENYRSVTYSDININNPAFSVNPDITDEKGFTADLGFRGNYNYFLSYDVGVFGLAYNDRIGFVQKALSDGRVISERGNIGNAMLYGVESLLDLNLKKIADLDEKFTFNYFVNTSFIQSKYTSSDQSGIKGNEVEFVPNINLKTGLKFGYKNLLANVQYTYLSSQYTDATNSQTSNLSGVIGEIPSYNILDLAVSYSYKWIKLESGINNVLNKAYFTRRATGYPGPGIIPSAPLNWYTTLQIKI